MLEHVNAITFHKQSPVGKTHPFVMSCKGTSSNYIEAYVKLVTACERKGIAMTCEAVTAMLAIDLDLPVPMPFVVNVSKKFATQIEIDSKSREQLISSIGPNFGSLRLPSGFRIYQSGLPIPPTALSLAAEIFAFDVLLANADRRPENPNLMFRRSGELSMIDHELCFTMHQDLSWRPPWDAQGINKSLVSTHVLSDAIRGIPIDFERLAGAFQAISDERLMDYRAALPRQWISDSNTVDAIFRYIVDLRVHVRTALQRIREVLT